MEYETQLPQQTAKQELPTQAAVHELPAQSAGRRALETPAPARRSGLRDDTVYVGKKNVMSYVLAVVTQFNQQGSRHVNVKARGKAISRAVDVSQIVKNRFISGLRIELGDVSTEELTSEDGSLSKVSSLTLVLTK